MTKATAFLASQRKKKMFCGEDRVGRGNKEFEELHMSFCGSNMGLTSFPVLH